jgi:Mn2+/Fe2+ NRAMP family transporter
MILLIAMLGLVVPIIHARPVWIIVMSQALGAIVLPVTVLSVRYLLNNKKLMGAHVLGRGANAALALVSLFSLVMASIGLYGVFEQFRS